jgi:hypothetical protein
VTGVSEATQKCKEDGQTPRGHALGDPGTA